MKITPREKRRHAAGREKNEGLQTKPKLFSLGDNLLALLFLRKNGGLLVVWYKGHDTLCLQNLSVKITITRKQVYTQGPEEFRVNK